VDAAELIERTAAAVAEGYRALDVWDAAGLLLCSYYDGEPEQLAPLALELREGEVAPDVDRDGYQRELGAPEVHRDPPVLALCEALNAHIERDADGYVLVEVYWLALAARLHRLLGIPVLVPGIETPVAEQLRTQLDVPMPDDPLSGLDVAVSLPIDRQRVAAVWRDPPTIWGSARTPADPRSIAWNTELGSDPEVRAGWLPPGATAATVRDRGGVWHEARTGRGVWLCALPQRSGQHDPPVAYRDVEGSESGSKSTSTAFLGSGRDKLTRRRSSPSTAPTCSATAPKAGTSWSRDSPASRTQRSARCRRPCSGGPTDSDSNC
jgi:hypothetical protein